VDSRSRENLARMAHEKDQEQQFLGGQAERMAAAAGALRLQVDPNVLIVERRRISLARTPQKCPHTSQQFFEGEWLGEIVIGAGVQPCHSFGNRVASREE